MGGGGGRGRIKINLTDAFPQPLYVSFIFLSELFQVYPKLLGDYVIKIDHGESVFALDGREIKLKLPDFIKQFNWPECVTYFKVIASTQPFETALFEQAPLPAPGTRSSEGAKGLKLKKNKKSSAHGWTTRLLTMRIKNPLYEEQ